MLFSVSMSVRLQKRTTRPISTQLSQNTFGERDCSFSGENKKGCPSVLGVDWFVVYILFYVPIKNIAFI